MQTTFAPPQRAGALALAAPRCARLPAQPVGLTSLPRSTPVLASGLQLTSARGTSAVGVGQRWGARPDSAGRARRNDFLKSFRPQAAASQPLEGDGAGMVGAPAVPKKSGGGFAKRAIVGVFLALTGAGLTLSGGLVYTAFISSVAWQASREYFGFVTAENITLKMKPPPAFVCHLATALSAAVCAVTYFAPRLSGSMLVLSAFCVLVTEILVLEKPKLSQITTSIFGLFYCGYLCSFWLKLRLLSAPALACPWASSWPVMLGGVSTWTVGLLAVLTSVSCVVAADSMAYIVGKNFGKTPLIKVSPRKTVEGALGGLAGSILTALAAWKFAGWPGTALQATALGAAIFISSLFGDLIESVMKRDAGMKDSSDLIPGHGGLLDRFDSYMFTGAMVYLFTGHLPQFGI